MSIIKTYDLSTLPGQQAKFLDEMSLRINGSLQSAKSQNESTVHSVFRDDSGTGGMTVQQKLDSFGTDGSSFLAAANAVRTMIMTVDPSYVPVTPVSLGYNVTVNPDGTLTATPTVQPAQAKV